MENILQQQRKNHFFEWEFLENAKSGILICLPVIVLLIQALPHIGRGYQADEIFSVIASRSLPGLFRMFRDLENNMSLFQVILYFWIRIFGESEIATHALSLLVAVITIPVFYRLERIWLNKTTSFFGALLLSDSAWFVHQSVESRSYAMLILSVTVSTLLYARWWKKPGYGAAVLYGLSVGIGVYVHYFAVLIPLVHVFTYTRKTFMKAYLYPLVAAGITAAVVISPLVLFPPHNKTQVAWMFAPDGMTLWYVLSAVFGGGMVFVILAACLVPVFISGLWKAAKEWSYEPEKLSVVWAFVPILAIWVFSNYVKPIFITRFFVWVIPGVMLFISIVIAYAGKNRWLKTGLFCLLLGLFAVKTVALFKRVGEEGYRSSVAYLNKEVKTGDAVLCYPYFFELETNFYLDRMGSTIPDARPVYYSSAPFLTGGGGIDPVPDLSIVEKVAKTHGRVFLFSDGNAALSRSDTLQTRLWLPKIESILAKEHPKKHVEMFETETQGIFKVQVFQ